MHWNGGGVDADLRRGVGGRQAEQYPEDGDLALTNRELVKSLDEHRIETFRLVDGFVSRFVPYEAEGAAAFGIEASTARRHASFDAA